MKKEYYHSNCCSGRENNYTIIIVFLKNYNLKFTLTILVYLLTLIIAIFILYNVPYSKIYIGERLDDTWTKKVSSCWQNEKGEAKLGCHHEKNDREKIILIGDSHASQLWFGLDKIYNTNYDVVILTSELFDGGTQNWFAKDQVEYVKNYIKSNKVTHILFAFAQHHLNQSKVGTINPLKNREIKIKNNIQELLKHSKNYNNKTKFILFNDTPRLSLNLPITTCIKQIKKLGKSDCDIEQSLAIKNRENLTSLIHSLKNENLLIYDPFKIICPNKVCSPIQKGNLMFVDQNHISSFGSHLIAEDMKDIIK